MAQQKRSDLTTLKTPLRKLKQMTNNYNTQKLGKNKKISNQIHIARIKDPDPMQPLQELLITNKTHKSSNFLPIIMAGKCGI